MQYRPFGRTGINVSEIVFGCGQMGGILIHSDPDTMRQAVRRALDAGVNWFDTAAQYGNGKSEESVGWLLKEVPEKPHVSTKIRFEPEQPEDIISQVERAVEASLKRLDRDSVDLLQFHNQIGSATAGRSVSVADVLRTGGAAEALERMRDQGYCRFIGLTALGDAAACREVIASGRFDAAQVYYNMINASAARPMPAGWTGQDMKQMLALCQEQRMGVICIRVFACGILARGAATGREAILTADTDPAEEERKARAIFAVLGDAYGSPAQTAIRFALANPAISTVSIGLANPAELAEDLAAAEMGPLPAEALDRIAALESSDFRNP